MPQRHLHVPWSQRPGGDRSAQQASKVCPGGTPGRLLSAGLLQSAGRPLVHIMHCLGLLL